MKKHIARLMILVILIPLLSFTNVAKLEVHAQENIGELTYTHNQYDYTVIPDAYNTGCKGDLIEDYDFFGEDYPEEGAFYLSYKLQDKYGTTLENIEFTRNTIVGKANQRSMVFKNCKFTTDATYSVSTYYGNEWTEDVTLTFINCDFTNYASAAVQLAPNISFINCKFYEAQGDGAKGGFNVLYKNCYFYNIGFADGAHADGIQWTQGADSSQVINCRFDMPYYDKYIPNAAIFFMLEQGADGSDNVLKDIYATGGNYTVYYGAKDTENSVIQNTTIENINIGCSYQYGQRNVVDSYSVPAEEFNMVDKLFVSSVYQENNKIKLYTTNYTNEEKTLICVTDEGTKEVTIPACPTYSEGLSYTSFSQFPFNIEIELDGSEYVVCYSDEQTVENQIRYVNFNEPELPELPDDKEPYIFDESTGTLYINENIVDEYPWYDYMEDVKNVVIGENVTTADGFFRGSFRIDNITLKSADTDISNCFSQYAEVGSITLPDNIKDNYLHTYDISNVDEDVWTNKVYLPYHKYNKEIYYDQYSGEQYNYVAPKPVVYINHENVSSPVVKTLDWIKWDDQSDRSYEIAVFPNQSKEMARYLTWDIFGGVGENSNGRLWNYEYDANTIFGMNALLPKYTYDVGYKIKPSDLDVNVLALGMGQVNTNNGSYWDYNTKSWKWYYEVDETEDSDEEHIITLEEFKSFVKDYAFTVDVDAGDIVYDYEWSYAQDGGSYCTHADWSYENYFIGRFKDDGTIEYTYNSVDWYDTTFTSEADALDNSTYKNTSDEAYPIVVLDKSYEYDSENDVYYNRYWCLDNNTIILKNANKYIGNSFELSDRIRDTDNPFNEWTRFRYDSTWNSSMRFYALEDEIIPYDESTQSYLYNGEKVYIGQIVDGKVKVVWKSWMYDTEYTTAEEALQNDTLQKYQASSNAEYYPIVVIDGYLVDKEKLGSSSPNYTYNVVKEYITMPNNADDNEAVLHSNFRDTSSEYAAVIAYIEKSFIEDNGIYYDPNSGYKKTEDAFVSAGSDDTEFYLYRSKSDYYEISYDGVTWEKVKELPADMDDYRCEGLGKEIDGVYYDTGWIIEDGNVYEVAFNELPFEESYTYEPVDDGSSGSGTEEVINYYNIGDAIYDEVKDVYYPVDFLNLYNDDTGSLDYYKWTAEPTVQLRNVNGTWYIDNLEDAEPEWEATDELIYNDVSYLPLEVSEITSATWNGQPWNLQDDLVVEKGVNTLDLEYNGLVYSLKINGTGNNGNIKFEANIESWFEINIPNQHTTDKKESAIVLPVAGDIPGNKSLVLSVTPNVTLTNGVDNITAVCALNKASYGFEELLQNPDANVNISVERLPVGRYVGQLSLTVGLRDKT